LVLLQELITMYGHLNVKFLLNSYNAQETDLPFVITNNNFAIKTVLTITVLTYNLPTHRFILM